MKHLIFGWLTLIVGLALSAVAAFYSVIGLSLVFAGAFWSVVVLASIMEIAKLISVSWLYRYRHLASRGVRVYLIGATLVLMLITSLGIFGYLTRAHVMTENVIVQAQLDLQVSQQQEQTLRGEQEQITQELRVLTTQSTQLINQLGSASRFGGASGAVRVQRENTTQRDNLIKKLDVINGQLRDTQKKTNDLQNQVNAVSVDVGPLRYVAQAIYHNDDIETIRVAVVWLTAIIMIVFDPMAIMLLIAANIVFAHHATLSKEPVDSPIDEPTTPTKPRKRPSKAKTKKSDANNTPSLVIPMDYTEDDNWSSASISDIPKSLL